MAAKTAIDGRSNHSGERCRPWIEKI